jgi:hypothetical protein
MRYVVTRGKFELGIFYVYDQSTGFNVCATGKYMFNNNLNAAEQMAIKLCKFLNDEHDKAKA